MKEQGFILLPTLFVIIILTFLGSVIIRLTTTELEISEKFSAGISAYYAAEAGVKRALVEIDNNTMRDDFTEVLKNSSSYHVTIKNGKSKQEREITAVGKCNGAVRKAAAHVMLPDPPRFACFSGDDMILSAKVIGTVGLRGTHITISEGGSIVNLAGYAAEPEINNSNFEIPAYKISFNENIYKYAQSFSNVLGYSSYSLQGIYYIDGDLVLKGAVLSVPSDSSATIFVKGNAELSDCICGNITVVSTGAVTLGGIDTAGGQALTVYADKQVLVSSAVSQALLVSQGDIKVNGSVHGVAIARGSVYVDSPLEGSVLAEKMVVQGSSGEVKYDERIFPVLGLTRPQVMAWDF